MAGVCEEAKIVFNVALAGALEERGFERVSDAHYARKETIGEAEVIWRVLFGPPLTDLPNSFRDATGYYIPEVDRLRKLAFPDEPCTSWSMAGTRYKSPYALPISERYTVMNKVRFQPWPKLSESDPCFREREGFNGRPSHWIVECEDLEALGHRLERYWCTYIEPWYLEVDDRIHTAPPIQSDYKFGDDVVGVSTILKHWVLGHQTAVKSTLSKIVEAEFPSREEIEVVARRRLREKGNFPLLWRLQKIPESTYSYHRESAIRRAVRARQVASVIGIQGALN